MKYLHRLIQLDLLSNCDINYNHRCEICVETKMAQLPFHYVERSIKSLDLILIDICNLKFIQTRYGE